MARIKKAGRTTINKEVKEFILQNRKNLSTLVLYGSEEVSIKDNVLCGGHFKLRSAMRQAGLSLPEIKAALE